MKFKEIRYNELPPQFQNWIEFYKYLKIQIGSNTSAVFFADGILYMSTDNDIKARVLDEILSNFEMTEFDVFQERGLFQQFVYQMHPMTVARLVNAEHIIFELAHSVSKLNGK